MRRQHPQCEGCWSRETTDAAHGFTRDKHATRWDVRNGFGLCRICHSYYSDHKDDWTEWLKARWGEEFYGEMQRLSNRIARHDMYEVVARLEAALDAEDC